MKVLHIKGKNTEEHLPKDDKYTFFDGDVYILDNGLEIYIWIGKDCGVDEKTVGAWMANKIDKEERGDEPKVITVLQGEEPSEFTNLLNFEVIDGDTAGFLVHAELDMVEYKLFRVYTKEETASFDDAFVEEVPLNRSSLNSSDVYILDGNELLYTWIGTGANREERVEGQKVMQKIDSGRQYLPLQYTVYEGEGGKSEKAFYEILEKTAKTEGPVLSVEDQRELEFKPEESLTTEEHKKEADKEFEDTPPEEITKAEPQTVGDLPPDRGPTPIMSKEDLGGAKLESGAESQAEEEAKRKVEETARLAAEEEAKRKAEEEARLAAEEEAKRKAEEAARLAAEEETKRKAEETARLEAEEEAKRKAEETARLAAEEEAKRKSEEEARLAAEEEAKRKAEEAAAIPKQAVQPGPDVGPSSSKPEATPVSDPRPVSGGAIKLYYIDGGFIEEARNIDKAMATIEIVGTGLGGVTKLSFSAGTGLILRRTASRQAESVTKSGFLLKSGERVGVGTRLEVIEGDSLTEAHLREGHKYNR